MKWVLCTLVVLSGQIAFGAVAADPTPDPFDLSGVNARSKDAGGIPTVGSVARLRGTAEDLFNAGNCAQALPALDKYARQTNYLANLISDSVQPFYAAPRGEKRHIDHTSLLPFENLSNLYKDKRNKAFLMQAECYEQTHDIPKAVAFYRHSISWTPTTWRLGSPQGMAGIASSRSTTTDRSRRQPQSHRRRHDRRRPPLQMTAFPSSTAPSSRAIGSWTCGWAACAARANSIGGGFRDSGRDDLLDRGARALRTTTA